MDAFTSQIPLNGMLCDSRLADQFQHTETLRPKNRARISCAGICGLSRFISYRTRGFDHAYVLTLLRRAFYFFSNEVKREHCLNGASLQQSTCAEITRLSIGT